MSDEEKENMDSDSAPSIIRDLLPITPGLSGGNVLEALDRKYLRGSELGYLSELSDLMVINDEAHHIHENKKQGEIEEVEWQKGLNKNCPQQRRSLHPNRLLSYTLRYGRFREEKDEMLFPAYYIRL